MEKYGYREMYEQLQTLFPGRAAISPKEAASVMGCDVRTVYTAMRRVNNPLPNRAISKKKVVIPVPQFAKWLV